MNVDPHHASRSWRRVAEVELLQRSFAKSGSIARAGRTGARVKKLHG